jgi:sugar/nucleoside kinase (ribokinase family)
MEMDITGIGTSGMDIISTPEGRVETPGSTITNTVIALAGLGIKTGYIGRAGKDDFGKAVLEGFEKEGIDISRFRVDSHPTTIFNVKISSGEREFIGADFFHPIKEFTEDDAKYIKNSSSLVCRPLPEILEFCIQNLKGVKLYLSLNDIKPSRVPVSLIEDSGPHMIFCNEEEFNAFKDIETLIKKETIIVVTRGKKGCRVYSQEVATDYRGFVIKQIDPTGAGDAFAAGYIYGDLKGWDENEKAEFANALGAMTAANHGPRIEVSVEKVKEFIKSRKEG